MPRILRPVIVGGTHEFVISDDEVFGSNPKFSLVNEYHNAGNNDVQYLNNLGNK